MKALLNKVFSTHTKYEVAVKNVNDKLKEVCDFNAVLTWGEGDGHLVLNEETSNVATLNCLNGKSAKNKLTEEEHEEYTL